MLNDPNWDKKVEVELDEVSKHILNAADWLEANDWVQSKLFGPNEESACTLGALMKVEPNHIIGDYYSSDISSEAGERIRKYLKLSLIGYWNDFPGRTKEQVINMLRTVAYKGGK